MVKSPAPQGQRISFSNHQTPQPTTVGILFLACLVDHAVGCGRVVIRTATPTQTGSTMAMVVSYTPVALCFSLAARAWTAVEDTSAIPPTAR